MVGAAEEERGGRVVDERQGPAVQGGGEVLGRDGVAALDREVQCAFPHAGEMVPCPEQVLLLRLQHGVGRRGFPGSTG
jgi:hypothetical protein